MVIWILDVAIRLLYIALLVFGFFVVRATHKAVKDKTEDGR